MTLQSGYVLLPGEGKAVWSMSGLTTIKASTETTQGRFGLFEQLLPPGFEPPAHVHEKEDEAFYILEGELSFRCGNQSGRATPGSFLFLPRGVVHSFRIESSTPAKILIFCTPGGFEHFFEEMGEPAQQRELPPREQHEQGQHEPEKITLLAAKYKLSLKEPQLQS
ncbi:quercetin 2,3-dioxygenase [Leptolyngbya sp. FACHB-261]|uniref:quercetin 2,3-dioxygenase n=1 Tax=Leptolyngbya sp. FACHB-261 TaxID=2692806 RepID=UPI0016826427|nr:quercetin 2,3-dioxygenase [Leptolyngbya sp. FACHB-261]MBD2102295.1 quercetin 2,3-dioxygenase [Leptolyngbya sp. FACHB-261]